MFIVKHACLIVVYIPVTKHNFKINETSTNQLNPAKPLVQHIITCRFCSSIIDRQKSGLYVHGNASALINRFDTVSYPACQTDRRTYPYITSSRVARKGYSDLTIAFKLSADTWPEVLHVCLRDTIS